MQIIEESFSAETESENNIIPPAPAPEPEESAGGVSENEPETGENDQEDNTPVVSENTPQNTETIKEIHHYESVTENIEVSNNVVIDPNDLVSVNSVSLNVLSADGLSLNSVSVNVSNNYISSNTIQIISADNVPFWNKPFNQYSTSEGLLFTILVVLTLGFVSNHLLRGLRNVSF